MNRCLKALTLFIAITNLTYFYTWALTEQEINALTTVNDCSTLAQTRKTEITGALKDTVADKVISLAKAEIAASPTTKDAIVQQVKDIFKAIDLSLTAQKFHLKKLGAQPDSTTMPTPGGPKPPLSGTTEYGLFLAAITPFPGSTFTIDNNNYQAIIAFYQNLEQLEKSNKYSGNIPAEFKKLYKEALDYQKKAAALTPAQLAAAMNTLNNALVAFANALTA